MAKKKAKSKKRWIAGAIKRPGALRKALKAKEGEPIPASKLAAAARKGGRLGRQARLAQTLKGLRKSKPAAKPKKTRKRKK